MILLCNLLWSVRCCMISSGLNFRPLFSVHTTSTEVNLISTLLVDFILLVSPGFCSPTWISSGSPIWDFSRSSSSMWRWLVNFWGAVLWHSSVTRTISLSPYYTFLSVCGCSSCSLVLAACLLSREDVSSSSCLALPYQTAAEHWPFLSGTFFFSNCIFRFPELNSCLILLRENVVWIKCNQALKMTWSVQPSTKWTWGSHETGGYPQLKALLFM